ncbi:hypothetical protein [Microbacterium esteraromaticum]|uniref:hypothetical protein n=1 Tax=Microbacterium esteraromaticum TaxID=57043 RepID=UPI0019D3F962|nr:hypothetical protein [Microbacterium esteraromaticum]MBN7792434.1 hypothetical protein [Microbacterium esteraromaticum]
MGFRIFNAAGRLTGGDGVLDDAVRDAARADGGYVLNDAGEVVFDARVVSDGDE